MKRETLLKRLESVDLPDLQVPGHRERLRKALLEGGHVSRQSTADRTFPLFGGLFSWLKGPAWRTALAGSLCVVIIGVILGGAFYLASPTPAVIAADVVRRDPGIQHRLSGAGEIIIVKVEIRDRTASVVCGRSMGDFIEADVDLDGRSVVNTRRFEGLFMPELPLEAQDVAIRTAMSDSTVKTMLQKGGTVGRVFPIFSSISNITVVNGNLVKVTPAARQAVVPVTLDGRTLLVQVDLEQQKVERTIEQQASPHLDLYYMFRQI